MRQVRPHLRHTIDTLLSHGFLFLSNQQIEVESAIHDKTGQYKTKHKYFAPAKAVAVPQKRFIPPTEQELSTYMDEQGFIDPINRAHDFLSYYETRGWIPSGQRSQMKSWKAAVRTWKGKERQNGNGHRPARTLGAEWTLEELNAEASVSKVV